jgi:hypothetical protein
MALYDGARWAGGIVGFAGAGYAVQWLGLELALLLGGLLPALGMGLIVFLRPARKTPLPVGPLPAAPAQP